MNYESMSDFEIACEVTRYHGDLFTIYDMHESPYVWNEYQNKEFSINNPADMWPITFASNISVINIKNTTQWFACSDVEFESICMSPDGNDSGISSMYAKNEYYCTNPLRAAAIVFLKMQEA